MKMYACHKYSIMNPFKILPDKDNLLDNFEENYYKFLIQNEEKSLLQVIPLNFFEFLRKFGGKNEEILENS